MCNIPIDSSLWAFLLFTAYIVTDSHILTCFPPHASQGGLQSDNICLPAIVGEIASHLYRLSDYSHSVWQTNLIYMPALVQTQLHHLHNEVKFHTSR